MDIDMNEFYDAKTRLEGIIHKTPILKSRMISEMSGNNVYLKCENLQKTGSFKIRGASNKIGKIVESGRRPSVIASSAGNHAQGVAYSATSFGLKSTIVMPKGAPLAKVEATRGYGAEVVLHGSCYDEAYLKARELCEENGAEFIHPYNDVDVIAGQGTIGLEIMEEIPNAEVVLVPAGGGGLLAGVACAVKNINPNVKVYGVQSEKADAVAKSFEQKEVVTSVSNTIADGIAVNTPGEITMELINRYVDGVVRVPEDSIAEAVLLLMERSKIVVEPAGASPIAAMISGRLDVKGKNVVCVMSGGNIDFTTVHSIIERGMGARHRIVEFFSIMRNNHDSISRYIEVISECGATILNLSFFQSKLVDPNEVIASTVCEISGKDHEELVTERLFDAGFRNCNINDINDLVRTEMYKMN